jgi:hypothetical protein
MVINQGGGGGVTAVTATAPLVITSAPATPNVSITPGTNPGDVLAWNGVAWIPGASGGVVGVANAMAYFDGLGGLTSVADFLGGALDTFGRPCIRDFRLGPGLRGVVHKLGAWGQDGDPQNVVSEGFVTYGANALGLGPSGSDGGLGFYTPNSFGALQVINGVNGNNTFYSCGYEDGGPMAPFGLDGFAVNDNLALPIVSIKRTANQALTARSLRLYESYGYAGVAMLGAGGTVVVPNVNVTPSSRFLLTVQDGRPGPLATGTFQIAARTPGMDFTIASSAGPADALVRVYWQIWEVA